MKRSKINSLMRDALIFLEKQNFKLPLFAEWTTDQWVNKGSQFDEIRDNMLGWDITDFGLGKFDEIGLLLFTIRNGNFNDKKYRKPYAEKILICEDRQITPYHFHWSKMEDIINRGGANLVIKCSNSGKNNEMLDTPVHVSIDGKKCVFDAGEKIYLKPGESITFEPLMYHTFWAEGGKLLVGEVSTMNDDRTDNCFYEKVGRFPDLEEDEPILYYLSNEYPK